MSNPELVAAVSNAGGLGILHPTAGIAPDGDLLENFSANIRRLHGLTRNPFAVCLYLPNPQIDSLVDVAVQEGVHIAVTYGGSPALYTGTLKDHRMIVLHQSASVRHARSAESQGVDIVVAEGFEGGGLRGADKVSTMVLVPQVVASVSTPVIASGGIVDSRGYLAAAALGAQGVQMGSRFVATRECISHQRYKEAIVAAIDSGTVILGGDRWPTRVLRSGMALRMKDETIPGPDAGLPDWEADFGAAKVRGAMLDGDLESSLAYTGAGAGLISDILTVSQIFEELERGTQTLARQLA